MGFEFEEGAGADDCVLVGVLAFDFEGDSTGTRPAFDLALSGD